MAVARHPRGNPENQRKAFEMADGWTKHIATLAAGTLVLSATFIKDLLPANSDLDAKGVLFTAWALLITSVVFSLLVLGGITSNLTRSDDQLDVFSPNIRISALLQFTAFVSGVILFVIFAGLNL